MKRPTDPNDPNKPPVQFPARPSAPGQPVNDPRAASYAASIASRRTGPPKYTAPVAGGPTPPIPHLDLPPSGAGLSMADQAMQQRITAPGGMSILQPPTGDGLLTGDILPNEARNDPDFRQGQGDMIAVNQPLLAKKYGVIRNGRPMAAQQLTNPGGQTRGLKNETVEGLAAVMQFNQERKKAESGENAAEAAAAASPAGAAARLANGVGDNSIKPTDQEELKKKIDSLDDFDFAALRQAMMKDLLNNDEQREVIEARLEPLDLTELIMRGRIRQRVAVVPGKFEPEFQSMTAEEDLALKRLVMEETKSLGSAAPYMVDKFSLMSAAVGIHAINKNPLPSHLDKDGNWDDDLFHKKLNMFSKFPFHMVASIGVNYFWFDIRVRKLFVAEKIKNG